MIRMKKCIAIILSITLCVVCGCNSQANEIKSITKKFEKSCNKVDVEQMLDCIDPSISKSVKTVTGLVDMFTPGEADELLEKVASLIFSELPEESKEFFSSIKISLDNIEIDGEEASATAEITYKILDEEYNTNASFKYICVDENWYISSLGLDDL